MVKGETGGTLLPVAAAFHAGEPGRGRLPGVRRRIASAAVLGVMSCLSVLPLRLEGGDSAGGLPALTGAALQREAKRWNCTNGEFLLISVRTGDVLAHSVIGNPPEFMAPMSMVKPLVIAAALRAGVVGADTEIDCLDGEIVVGGRTFRDMRGYGRQPVREILKARGNIGTIRIAQLLGKEKLLAALAEFGIPVPAGELSEAEFAALALGLNCRVTAGQLTAAWRKLSRMSPAVLRLLAAGSCAGPLGSASAATVRLPGIQYSCCIGFFPSDRPEFLLLIRLGGNVGYFYGGVVAAPAWKRFVETLPAPAGGIR